MFFLAFLIPIDSLEKINAIEKPREYKIPKANTSKKKPLKAAYMDWSFIKLKDVFRFWRKTYLDLCRCYFSKVI